MPVKEVLSDKGIYQSGCLRKVKHFLSTLLYLENNNHSNLPDCVAAPTKDTLSTNEYNSPWQFMRVDPNRQVINSSSLTLNILVTQYGVVAGMNTNLINCGNFAKVCDVVRILLIYTM